MLYTCCSPFLSILRLLLCHSCICCSLTYKYLIVIPCGTGIGIDQTDVMLLESHTLYSHSKEKTTSIFFIMQCSHLIDQEVIQLPIKDVIDRFVLIAILFYLSLLADSSCFMDDWHCDKQNNFMNLKGHLNYTLIVVFSFHS